MAKTVRRKFWGIDCIIRHDYEDLEISKKLQDYQTKSVNTFKHFLTNVPDFPNFRSLLDIGCGDDFCINQFRDTFEEVKGIDLYVNPGEYQDVVVSDWYTMAEDVFKDKKFDAVFMNHSMEHAENIYALMQQTSALQNKGGAIFVAVPDGVDPFGFAITSSTTHFSVVTEGFLRTTLQRFGYNVEVVKKELRPGAPELWAYGIKQYDSFSLEK
jgi:predicted TPR repeat methyltransferase